MKKIYIATLSSLLLITSSVDLFAQRKTNVQFQQVKKPTLSPVNSIVSGTSADCDTINYPFPSTWDLIVAGPIGDPGGYILGPNGYGDKQKANYFDLSSTTYTYITGAGIYFGVANSNVSGNLSKNVIFKVYSDASGEPGSQIGTSVSIPLSQIKSDVDASLITEIEFSPAIAMPANKKFYISADFTNFKWNASTKDAICVISNDIGQTVPGTAWEQWSDNTWNSVASSWSNGVDDFDVTALFLPYVSTSATGCSALPVKLLSFNAQRNNKDVVLNWQIADEYNMKGYEVQRADNNGVFKTVQTITAYNNLKNQSYSITDKNAFTTSSTVQYRLKQIDGDGSAKYSRVISVKANTIISDITFANPFNGALKLQLNLASTQNISVQLFDMQGKPVVSQLNKMYNASSNSIVLNGTSSLKPGMYVLKINAGTEQLQYKVIKQ